jgi:hypothetical protein
MWKFPFALAIPITKPLWATNIREVVRILK